MPSFEIITKLVRKKSGGRDGPDSHSLLATPSILLVDWKTQTHVEKNTQSWRTREVMEDTGSVEKTGDIMEKSKKDWLLLEKQVINYRKDRQSWKSRAVIEKSDTHSCGKEKQSWEI